MTQVDEHKTDAGDGLKNGREEASSRVVFDEAQQAKVQELIDDAYRKAYAKAQKAKAGGGDVERLAAEVERLKEDKKMASILRSVSRHNVVDAEEIAELLKGHVRIGEDGGISVTGQNGALRTNGMGVPVTLDEYVANWLSERPHHLRSSGRVGAGSSNSMFAGRASAHHNLGDPFVWRTMPREDLDQIINSGISIHGSAGQVYRFKNMKNPFIEARRRRFK